MICYRDRSYCAQSRECKSKDCASKLDLKEYEAYKSRTYGIGQEPLDISMTNFTTCKYWPKDHE